MDKNKVHSVTDILTTIYKYLLTCAKATEDEAEMNGTGYCGVRCNPTGKMGQGPGQGRVALRNLTAATLRNVSVIPTPKIKRGGEIPNGTKSYELDCITTRRTY